MVKIDSTDLDVFPLCLGGNVFGWTADKEKSLEVLDTYAAAGGNFVDTADVYSAWKSGNSGGESEAILGAWFSSRKNRSKIILATKVGMHPQLEGLSAKTIQAAAERSLERLKTDYIDIYYAHVDDPNTPLRETLSAFDALVKAGKVRHIAASNYKAYRLTEALRTSKEEGLCSYIALQQHYNLMERKEYEGELLETVQRAGLSSVPYFSLASGFLAGKYRPGVRVDSQRAEKAGSYLDERGKRVLAALDEVAAAHDAKVASVALAWLKSQPTVVSVIASARTKEQLPDLLKVAGLELTQEEVRKLTAASEL
ncbi:MAG: aldo/keto reductase [Verrucomicrobia bacterium]|nr:aldo/keto reductase [Verrucomicrobiota bacterium]